MDFRDVKAKCAFCQATVNGNQEKILGLWDSPDDLTPRWKLDKGRNERHWLWYAVSSDFDSGKYQDFYLCPQHNDPDHFHSVEDWAWGQFQKGIYVDFTELVTSPILPEPIEKWGARTPLLEQIPDIIEVNTQTKLPNSWQYQDPRLEGCLPISYAIVDTWDMDWSPFIVDQLELDSFPSPLELAEAMKKAAIRIELLTEK